MGRSRARAGHPCPRFRRRSAAALLCALAAALTAPAAQAAITHVNATTGTTGAAAATVSVSKPAGVQAGDVLTLTLAASGNTAVPVPPGWTAQLTPPAWGVSAATYTKVAAAGDPATFVFGLGGTREAVAGIAAWRGADTVQPIDPGAVTYSLGFGSPATAPSVTTSRPGDVALVGVVWLAPVTSSVVGASPLPQISSASALTTHSGYFFPPAVGATGARTFTATPSWASWGTGTLALQEVRAPTVSAVSPVGPSSSNTPSVTGTAGSGSWTVDLYTNASCTSSVVGTGTGTEFASPGITATAPSDATTTIYAKVSDAYGNSSRCSTSSASYTEDSTVPAAPSVSGPATPSAGRAPSWSFSGEPGGTYECRLTGGSLPGTWASCTSPTSSSLTGQPDGAYTFEVRQTDAAGNTGVPSSSAYVLDTTAPAAPGITGPATPGTTRTPAWSLTAELGAGLECRLDRGATQIAGWAACTSPRSYDLSLQPDGTYTLSARAADAAGNTSTVATSTYVLDTVAPPAPTVTAPASPGNDQGPSWGFAGEPGGTFECRLDRGATQIADWTSCSVAQGYALGAEPDGTYTFSVRQTDTAGNLGAVRTSTYVLDRSAPSAPSVTPPVSPGSGRSPAYAFTGEAGGTFECRLDRGATQVFGWAACTSAKTYDLTGQPDGAHAISVRQTDAAGNVGAAGTAGYVLDTSGPAAPAVTGPSSPDLDRNPAWSFSGEAGGTFQCRLDRGATVVSGWAGCTSPRTYDLGIQPDGTYTLSVRQLDAAGNVGATQTSTYVLDTVAPAAPTVSDPPSPGTDRVPSWGFSGEAGASYECRLDRGATPIAGWTSCAGAHGFDLLGEPDGTYTFSVRQTDVAGNVGPAGTGTYVYDTTAPAAPAVTAPASPDNDRSPAFTFTGEAGGSYECRLDQGATPIAAWAACASAKTYDLTGRPDGTYTVSVRQTDAAGNPGATGTADYTLDGTAPPAPVIASPLGSGSSVTPAWSFAGEAGATFECRLDRGATTVAGWATCTDPKTYDLATEPDGTYTFSVRAVDAVGNTGPAATDDYTMNTTRPAAPALTATPASPAGGRTPSWSFTVGLGETADCRLVSGATVISDWAACTSAKVYDLTGRPDGAYTFSVRAVNGVGTASASATNAYVLDTAGPAAPAIDAMPGTATDLTPTWAFSGEAGATFECRLERGATVVAAWGTCTDPTTFDLTGQPDGSYRFLVRATDVAGNTGATQTSDWTLDTTPPSAPAIVTSPGAVGSSRAPSWTFSAPGAASAECRLTGGTLPGGWAPCTTSAAYDLTSQVDGTFTFSVRATDAAGNTGPASTRDYRLDTAAPGAPSITGGPGARGNNAAAAWAFTGEAGASFECRLLRGGATVADWATCATPRGYDLVSSPDGAYRFEVRAVDAAGNTGSAAGSDHQLDRSAPGAPTITGAPGPVGSQTAVTWSVGGAAAGTTLECRLTRGGGAVADWAACAGDRSFDLAGQPDGAYDFAVRARNDLGTPGTEATARYVLDRVAPALPVIVGSPGELGRSRGPVWAFSAEPGDALECRVLRSGTVAEDWAACTSPKGHDLTGAPDGPVTFGVRSVDGAGNRSAPRESGYELDTTPPAAPRITDGPGASGTDRRPTWAFTSEPAATFQCRLKGGEREGDWASCAGQRTFDLTSTGLGDYDFAIRATDRAGNTGPSRTAGYTLVETGKTEPRPATSGQPVGGSDDHDSERAAAPAGGSDPGDDESADSAAPDEREHATPPAPAAKRNVPAREIPRATARRRTPAVPGAPAARTSAEKESGAPKGAPAAVATAVADAAKKVAQVAGKAAEVAVENADKSVFPGGLLLMVLGFLSIQGRIDRNDPKLAMAPAGAEPDLTFNPPTPVDAPIS